jgi:hypothetical protein
MLKTKLPLKSSGGANCRSPQDITFGDTPANKLALKHLELNDEGVRTLAARAFNIPTSVSVEKSRAILDDNWETQKLRH